MVCEGFSRPKKNLPKFQSLAQRSGHSINIVTRVRSPGTPPRPWGQLGRRLNATVCAHPAPGGLLAQGRSPLLQRGKASGDGWGGEGTRDIKSDHSREMRQVPLGIKHRSGMFSTKTNVLIRKVGVCWQRAAWAKKRSQPFLKKK